ncbi:MAG: hypothetical protein ACREA0_34550, partial [bacterium]
GYSGGSTHVGRYVVTETIDMANANQMYVASHVHYISVSEASETITKLVDTYENPPLAPWDPPNWRVATELGITADPTATFFTQNNGQRTTQYKQYFFPNIGDPEESWDDFIDAWTGTTGQFGQDGPQLDGIIDLFADSGYLVVCYGALQYDTGTVDAPSVYLIEALRATKLRDEDFSEDPTDLFTPIRVMYENAASPYEITSFSPHTNPCNPDDVCEGCDP